MSRSGTRRNRNKEIRSERTRVPPTSLLIPVLSGFGALPDSFLESLRTSILANISKLMARLLRTRVRRGACPGHRLERTLATGPELAPPSLDTQSMWTLRHPGNCVGRQWGLYQGNSSWCSNFTSTQRKGVFAYGETALQAPDGTVVVDVGVHGLPIPSSG